MIYGDNLYYDTQSIFEIVELINHDMEQESGYIFYHALDASVSNGKDGIPHIEWALINNETLKLAKIGEYTGSDQSFFKRFMAAHRTLFEGKLKESGMKKPQIEKAYERWYNRGLRSLPITDEEEVEIEVSGQKPRRDEIRRFELINKDHRKFWTIQKLVGGRARSFTVVFGRIPEGKRPIQLEKGRGQVQTKKFKTAAECNEAYEKLIEEKRKKGYRETLHTFAQSGPSIGADLDC